MDSKIKQAQREEAIRRLEYLQGKGLEEAPVREFKADGTVNYSERAKFGNALIGILYWVRNEARFAEAIRKFEEENDAIVFHATHEHTNFGELLDLFFVSAEQEEWEMEFDDLRSGYAFCHVLNLSDPMLSEFGTIGYECALGGLIRTM